MFFDKGQLRDLYRDGIPEPLVEALRLDVSVEVEWRKAGREKT